ncbi:TWiK family of potassium channels protein 7-like isoform X2 [Acanthaster planci]|uniref:TWiK family of potassium channels protein 7-like isoform X2 n=1 Tax=Acanthaster planci TaxID=133434 RepID=A0A8B7XIX9_ACAPL|nr:TWiK family of potassium channels protein 7-like isoform X2 [Acanthaster planci]
MAEVGERESEEDQDHRIVMEEHYDEGPDYCKLVQHYTITYVALFICLVVYVCIGAGVFQALEYPKEKEIYQAEYEKYLGRREDFLGQMWNITEFYGDNKEEWLDQAIRSLNRLEKRTGTFVIPPRKRKIKWTFVGALFFSCTVISTIGYGNIAPVTIGGRVFCMIYAVFGIAMLLLVLASIGSLFARGATLTYRLLHMNIAMAKGAPPPKKKKKLRAVRVPAPAEGGTEGVQMTDKQTNGSTEQPPSMDDVIKEIWSQEPGIDQGDMPPMHVMTLKGKSEDGAGPAQRDNAGTSNDDEEENDQVDIPLSIVLIFALMYVCMLAGLLCLWENQWNYFDAFYFSFITLTTIGFGDLVPEHQKNLLGCTFFILLGMAIMSMCIALAQEIITKKVAWISEKVGVALIKAKPT